MLESTSTVVAFAETVMEVAVEVVVPTEREFKSWDARRQEKYKPKSPIPRPRRHRRH